MMAEEFLFFKKENLSGRWRGLNDHGFVYVSEYELHFSSSILKLQHLAAREESGLAMHFWYNFRALFCRVS